VLYDTSAKTLIVVADHRKDAVSLGTKVCLGERLIHNVLFAYLPLFHSCLVLD
jgi:hypothetical protein